MNEVWTIGQIKITRVVEMEVTGGTRFILPDASREACLPYDWMRPHFMDEKGNLIMSIHALVVDTGKRKIVVDTCIGNDKERDIPNWSNLQTRFLFDLEDAGYPADTIDTVLCTHLHVDHVGWNTKLEHGEWVPTFKNAQYLIAKSEWEHWNKVNSDGSNTVMADSVYPIIDAGLATFVEEQHIVAPGVWLIPTPGHTPGHVSVYLQSRGESALITGDCIHHPVQMSKPEWCSSADSDQELGLITRKSLLEKYADSSVLIIGTHFASPTAGYVKKQGENEYRLDVNLKQVQA